MNRDKLIRELRHYAKVHHLAFDLDTKRGKGSHYVITLGEKKTMIQSDIDEGRANRIRKQLGITR